MARERAQKSLNLYEKPKQVKYVTLGQSQLVVYLRVPEVASPLTWTAPGSELG